MTARSPGSVSAYDVAGDGTLTAIGDSPFADNQTAPCWVEVSHDGNYLFAINTGSGSISSYAIAVDGSLTLLGSVPFNSATGLQPFDAQLDPSGGFLYVVDAGAAKVSAFAVDGGTLTELPSSPIAIPGGVAPVRHRRRLTGVVGPHPRRSTPFGGCSPR